MLGHNASSIIVSRWLKLRKRLNLQDVKVLDWDDRKFRVWVFYSVNDHFAFTVAQHDGVSLTLAEALTLCEDISSNIQVSSHFNQLALFTKRSKRAFNWVPNRTPWYRIHCEGKTGFETQDAKMSIENVWTHQSLTGFLPLLCIRLHEIDHPLFLNFIMWEEEYQ